MIRHSSLSGPRQATAHTSRPSHRRRRNRFRPDLLPLESRRLLAAGFSPAQIRHAYGIDHLEFGNASGQVVAADGSGMTVAIVDAFSNPLIGLDLSFFDLGTGLPAPPSFQVVNQTGGSSLPAPDVGWGSEEALDVEWVHAMAPGANILLVEANSNSAADFGAAIDFARSQPGVVAVSMSFSGGEVAGETTSDSHFLTPAGHVGGQGLPGGVTFLASTGDNGKPGGYPAYSPNVVAVGGTSLSVDSQSNYVGETGWSGSGGGISQFEPQPAYQHGVVTQSTTQRTIPDVSFDADPATGVEFFDLVSAGGWSSIGGTSLSTPMWAGLIAVADQGRAVAGFGALDGPGQTLPGIYQLPATDFHDITSGNNGFAAGTGYDLVTGLGSPVAEQVAADLGQAAVLNAATGNLDVGGVLGTGGDTILLGTVTLSGTTFIDVSVRYGNTASSPVHTSLFPASSVHSIAVDPGNGNDFVTVEHTLSTAPVTIVTGKGSTSIAISPSAGSLGNIQGSVTIRGHGSVGLTLFDQNNPSAATYVITGSYVQRTGSAAISYSGVGFVTIDGGSGNDIYGVSSTVSGTSTTVNAGAGNDTFNVLLSYASNGSSVDDLQGAVTVSGGGGTDTLNILDQADVYYGDVFTITRSTIQRTASAPITYGGMEDMIVDGSTSAPIYYNVTSTLATTPLAINAGAGNDTFNVTLSAVSPVYGYQDTLQGALTINGGTGVDQLNVLDTVDPFSDTYTITSSTVARSFSALITFASVEGLTIDGGSGNVTYDVENTASVTPVTIQGGAGNDTVNATLSYKDPSYGYEDTLQGNLTVMGGGGVNQVNVLDTADPYSDTYTITPTTVTRSVSALITFASVEGLTIDGGYGSVTYDDQGTTSATAVTVVGGLAGPNTLVGPNTGSSWTMTGAGRGTVGNLTFSNMYNLTGGSSNDAFAIQPGASLEGTIDGGLGTNTIDYSHFVTTPGASGVTVDLALGMATNIGSIAHIYVVAGSSSNDTLIGDANADTLESYGGNDYMFAGTGNTTFWLYGETATSTTLIIGGPGSDTVWGNSTPNTWQLTGTGAGKVNAVTFSGITSLLGGLSTDTFVFHPGASFAGTINGNYGVNTLDYSAFTAGIVVNLRAGAATGTGRIAYIQNVTGGQGNDILVGDASANVLNGGPGSNLIIGGGGADQLVGGPGSDLLIAGSTSYDLITAALEAILAEWQRTDVTYAVKVTDLRNGVGSGHYRLVLNTATTAGTVFDDDAADVLTGGAGLDWFWCTLPQDTITDLQSGEQVD